ncbi:hypothetical protein BC829DRAFT_392658 [Chytridium lagenaria]|nr:hypothetical protein BC829DRAFT_392658 [Chytridium lagenaria]
MVKRKRTVQDIPAVGTATEDDITPSANAQQDHYETHFTNNHPEPLASRIDKVTANAWEKASLYCEHLHSLQYQALNPDEITSFKNAYTEKQMSPSAVKKRLLEPFNALNKERDLSDLQKRFFLLLSRYTDVMMANNSDINYDELRSCYHLHVMNHVFKTRDKVLKNNTKVNEAAKEDAKVKEAAKAEAKLKGGSKEDIKVKSALNEKSKETKEDLEKELRDQGFTRAKALLILRRNISLSKQVQRAAGGHVMDEKKPDDYKTDFAGNVDDCFRIGIKFSRKHLRLFSDFYSSDIVIASPLGLRLALEKKEGAKGIDTDFLSSIEVVIVDRCDYLLMQNWEHLQFVFESLNKLPTSMRDCDFSRTKQWYLDGQAKYLRQTVLISKFLSPEVLGLFNRSCTNVFGKVKSIGETKGLVAKVVSQIPQLFYKVPCDTVKEADNARFHFFTEKILPELMGSINQSQHVLVFISSYFDFVRLRNHFNTGSHSFGELSEYTKDADISRVRSSFFHGKVDFVLYTERFHFFRRYHIRNTQHIVFYSLPENSHFYPEIVNFVGSSDGTCTCLFTKFDKFRLERIVGTDRLSKVIGKDTFLFA